MAKPEKCHRWWTKRTGLGTAVGYLREYEQKKAETARESVTRLMMVLVQERKRDTAHDGVGLSGGAVGAIGVTQDAKLLGLFCGRIFLRKRLSVL